MLDCPSCPSRAFLLILLQHQDNTWSEAANPPSSGGEGDETQVGQLTLSEESFRNTQPGDQGEAQDLIDLTEANATGMCINQTRDMEI